MQIFVVSLTAGGADGIAVGLEITEDKEDKEDKESKDGKGVRKEKFLISTDFYIRTGIKKGECGVETYGALEEEAEIYAAYKRGTYILGFGGCSKKNLVSKLVSKGFQKDAAEKAADRICEKGFLCEEENAKREAERCAAKFWGPTRIKAHLCSKGYGSELIRSAFLALEDKGVDFDANCRKLLDGKCQKSPAQRNEMQKLIASMARCGYSVGQIKRALADKAEENEFL